MRVVAVAVIVAFLAGPADWRSQKQGASQVRRKGKGQDPRAEAAEKDAEKAYKRSSAISRHRRPSIPGRRARPTIRRSRKPRRPPRRPRPGQRQIERHACCGKSTMVMPTRSRPGTACRPSLDRPPVRAGHRARAGHGEADRAFEAQAGQRIFDIGCGCGAIAIELARQVGRPAMCSASIFPCQCWSGRAS